MTKRLPGFRLTVILVAMLVSMAGGAFIVSRLPGHAADHPDLVLIVLDTVRYDRTSLPPGVEPGSNSDTTPFLRELASRGISFTRARAPAEWTLPSHASMFTGLLPSRHLAHYDHRYLADDAPTLAEWLSARGYVTAAFSANPNVSRTFNFDQGFDHFFEAFREEETIAHGSKSGAILAALGKWVTEQRQGPRFVFVNLMDAHLPYAADPAHLARFAPRGGALDAADLAAADFLDRVVAGERPLDDEFVAALKERYDAALRTVDDRLRQVVELLERRGVLGKNSLLVVTSDHGERLGEDGRVDHQGSLSEVLLRVPLVFVGRGATGGVSNDTPVGLESIAGHLSGAALDGFRPSRIGAGTPLVAERFPAYPILDRIRARWPALDLEEFAHQEWAIVDPAATFKLCVRDDGRERLYRLAPVGVGETLVEDGQENATRAELRAALARHRERSRPLKERFAPERFERGDADLEDELAALAQSGYTATAARGATSIHAQVHLERGNRAFAAGDLESARRDYLGAADLDPRFPAPLFNLAIVAERLSAPLAERIDAWERYLAVALKSDIEDRAKLEQAYGRLEALRAAPSR